MLPHIQLEDRNSYISRNYVTSWKLKEGVREIIQNLIDAVTDYAVLHDGHRKDVDIWFKEHQIQDQKFREYTFLFKDELIGRIKYDHIRRVLQCSNPGTIPIGAILLGGTEKNITESFEVIGRFGEGLKLAALALLREEKTISIKTGEQTWTFFLKEDSTFGHVCLHFSIVGPAQEVQATTEHSNSNNNNATVKGTTVVEIGNLSIKEWSENIKHFLDLTDETLYSMPDSDETMGAVLLGPALRGRLFVKGIHVKDLPKESRYGFNIIKIDLDRDRRCIPDVWDQYRRTSQLLANVQNNREEHQRKYSECRDALDALEKMLEEIYDMLANNHQDIWFFNEYVSTKVADKLFVRFKSKLRDAGKNVEAMPITGDVANTVEKEMRDHGISSSAYPYELCSSMLYHTLIKSTAHYRTLQQRIDDHRGKPDYQPDQLEQEIVDRVIDKIRLIEQEIVDRVIDKIRLIEPPFTRERIIFKEQISYQLFFTVDNNIYLSKELLSQDEVQKHESKCLTSSQHLREYKIFALCMQLLGISSLIILTHNVTFP